MNDLFKLDFLTETNYVRVLIGIFLLFICCLIIEKIYNKYIISNDNKVLFTKHMFSFVISMFLIVTVIKSSIALSLGLVGALSIIRFRTAIKEPGQLITLLVLTSLAISFAAEKEILGILITIIFSIHSIFKNNSQIENYDTTNKILRVSFSSEIGSIDKNFINSNFTRFYKDTNNIFYLEFDINEMDDINKINNSLKSKKGYIGYEVF